jgi:hypothetical protein
MKSLENAPPVSSHLIRQIWSTLRWTPVTIHKGRRLLRVTAQTYFSFFTTLCRLMLEILYVCSRLLCTEQSQSLNLRNNWTCSITAVSFLSIITTSLGGRGGQAPNSFHGNCSLFPDIRHRDAWAPRDNATAHDADSWFNLFISKYWDNPIEIIGPL